MGPLLVPAPWKDQTNQKYHSSSALIYLHSFLRWSCLKTEGWHLRKEARERVKQWDAGQEGSCFLPEPALQCTALHSACTYCNITPVWTFWATLEIAVNSALLEFPDFWFYKKFFLNKWFLVFISSYVGKSDIENWPFFSVILTEGWQWRLVVYRRYFSSC